ncbi:MAG: replication factor A1 [archaeon GW2011_AR5]|nr:MAG: replication factor A1 [archaeon GW2011_AR5]
MLNELLKKISSESGMDEREIMDRIEEKRAELSDLISEEGAAYIVAKELGISIVKQERLDISHVIPGMQNVDVVGRITKLSPVREFSTEKGSGRVANVTIADETGSVRLSLWNDEIKSIEGMETGDTIRVRGYVKEDNLGNPEIRIGRYGAIAKSDETIATIKQTRRSAERVLIRDLSEGGYKEIRSPLIQIFESNVFYEICPQCRSRIKLDEKEDFVCADHGVIESPDYGMIISGIADDGSESIRIVFFNENAEKILGMTTKEAKKLFDKKKKLDAILGLIPLGREFVFEGRARRNQLFERLEFITSDVKPVDVKQEIEMILNNLSG